MAQMMAAPAKFRTAGQRAQDLQEALKARQYVSSSLNDTIGRNGTLRAEPTVQLTQDIQDLQEALKGRQYVPNSLKGMIDRDGKLRAGQTVPGVIAELSKELDCDVVVNNKEDGQTSIEFLTKKNKYGPAIKCEKIKVDIVPIREGDVVKPTGGTRIVPRGKSKSPSRSPGKSIQLTDAELRMPLADLKPVQAPPPPSVTSPRHRRDKKDIHGFLDDSKVLKSEEELEKVMAKPMTEASMIHGTSDELGDVKDDWAISKEVNVQLLPSARKEASNNSVKFANDAKQSSNQLGAGSRSVPRVTSQKSAPQVQQNSPSKTSQLSKTASLSRSPPHPATSSKGRRAMLTMVLAGDSMDLMSISNAVEALCEKMDATVRLNSTKHLAPNDHDE